MCVEKALTEERKNVKSFVFVHFSFQYHQIKLGPLSFSISVKRRAHKREEKLIEVLSTSFVVISIEALSYKDSLSCSILGCCWSIFIAYYRNGRSISLSIFSRTVRSVERRKCYSVSQSWDSCLRVCYCQLDYTKTQQRRPAYFQIS